jgi:hypothetical protein
MAKIAALVLAGSRIGFGAGYLVAPGTAQRWVGRAAQKPGGRLLAQALGARDLALAGGALQALARDRPREASTWMLAQVAADGADLAATLSERDSLSRDQAALGMGMAGASVALAVFAALGLRSRDRG